MKFGDLFEPMPLRMERTVEIRSFNLGAKNEDQGKENESIREVPGLALSALSAPLVPLDSPFVDRQRYRLAGATEIASRLDCYLADPAGLWQRQHGVLVAVQAGVHLLREGIHSRPSVEEAEDRPCLPPTG